MANTCKYCSKEIIDGTIVSAPGGGIAHHKCYHIVHPFKGKESFAEVLCNFDDQVLVRNLLDQYVPPEIKQWIIDDFNSEMTNRHAAYIAG